MLTLNWSRIAIAVSGFSVLLVGMGMGCDQDKKYCEGRFTRDYEIGACFNGAHTLSAKLQSSASAEQSASIQKLQADNMEHDTLEKRGEFQLSESSPVCKEKYSEPSPEYNLCIWGAMKYSLLKSSDEIYASCKEVYEGRTEKWQVEACSYGAQELSKKRVARIFELELEMHNLQQPLEDAMLDLCWADADQMLKNPDELNANLKKLLGEKASGSVRPEDLARDDLSKACLDGGMWALAGRI